MGKDYTEKIKKLLKLAESPNPHEAKAALLKARQLMKEHKISEAMVKDTEKREVKKILTDITFSERRDPWIENLSVTIGENYCCRSWHMRTSGMQTKTIGFVGLDGDIDVCISVFKYAVACVQSDIKRIRADNDGCYSTQYVKQMCNSYGFGYGLGVKEAFQKQNESNEEYGLVMVVPQEVEETMKTGFKEVKQKDRRNDINIGMFFKGNAEGRKFRPQSRIGQEA